MPAILILSTIPEIKTGKHIAKTLVDEKLAACVNIIPYIRSFYIWEGKTEEDDEALMIIKTEKDLENRIIQRIKELHPYSLPEIITFNISGGLPEYLNWIFESVRK
ncbi:divalent-cation tolerance protein CutA [Acidianus brierleyi]|uniref:Divalent-cation tolerance protein CutA n=1 Tax=Acidianus brierleyi TaxID=41673 RepID=A0A2U9IG85_9CREN|nr:divalent-cation tolerance protein CutA [Acidianus brierleyi]AWR95020.1 divalent cation tolerance protein CutA [Acidianus brierleyi]